MNTIKNKWFTRENLARVAVVLLLLGFYYFGPANTGGAQMVTIHEALAVREGDIGVEGVVEPRLTAQNLAFRAMDYNGVRMAYFRIRDATGLIGVYFDPNVFSLPDVGANARVVGYKEVQPGSDASIFIATEFALGDLVQ